MIFFKRIRNLLISAIVILSIFPTASVTFASNRCESIFQSSPVVIEQYISHRVANFGRSINYELDHSIEDLALREKLLASGKDGKFEITWIGLKFNEGEAYTYFRVIPNMDAIVVDMVFVPPELRGQGVSNKLLELILDQVPGVRKLVFDLDQSNRDIFYHNKSANLTLKLFDTPIYKSFSKLGFTQVDNVSEILVGNKATGKIFPHVILSKPEVAN